jgi:hypothetical protein
MKLKPAYKRLCAGVIIAACSGAVMLSRQCGAETNDPFLGRMTILEVDQFNGETLIPNIFTNTLWVEQPQNEPGKYLLFATRPLNALGKGSGCGGHGCNLQRGEHVGSFRIKYIRDLEKGRLYAIKDAEGDMSMLEDRLCTWQDSGTGVLTCSAQTPLRATDGRNGLSIPLYTFRLSNTP